MSIENDYIDAVADGKKKTRAIVRFGGECSQCEKGVQRTTTLSLGEKTSTKAAYVRCAECGHINYYDREDVPPTGGSK